LTPTTVAMTMSHQMRKIYLYIGKSSQPKCKLLPKISYNECILNEMAKSPPLVTVTTSTTTLTGLILWISNKQKNNGNTTIFIYLLRIAWSATIQIRKTLEMDCPVTLVVRTSVPPNPFS
jgi:hypothetical protein